MSVYHYAPDSVIREVDFRHSEGSTPVALLAARDGISSQQASAIRTTLKDKGWLCVPVSEGEREWLQVSGFKTEAEMQEALKDSKHISGTAKITEDSADLSDDADKKGGFGKFIKRYSLKIAGLLNVVGDIAMLISAIHAKNYFKITAGSLYTLGGANLVFLGNSSRQQTLSDLTARVAEFTQQHCPELPSSAALAGQESSTIGKVGRFLRRNAANVTLTAYTAGAGTLLYTGIQESRQDPTKKGLLFYSGSSLLFKGISLLVPENAPSHEAAGPTEKVQGNVFERGLNWLKEKPLRIFGYGSFITDSLYTRVAYEEYKTNKANNIKKSIVLPVITTITYLLADIFTAISSKSSGALNPEEKRQIEAMAAEALAAQPQAQRGELTERMAEFLNKQPELKGDPEAARQSLLRQVERLAANPWAIRTTQESNAGQLATASL